MPTACCTTCTEAVRGGTGHATKAHEGFAKW